MISKYVVVRGFPDVFSKLAQLAPQLFLAFAVKPDFISLVN